MKNGLIRKIFSLLFVAAAFVCTLAACNKVQFKVDFIVDGAVYATIDTNGGETVKIPADPEKEDFIFDGWYWDKDSWQKPFTANSLLDAPISGNMSVYAKWITAEAVTGVQAVFSGFEKTGDYEYSMKVANGVTTLSIAPLVTVNSRSGWSLSSDVFGNDTIASKTVALEAGDNTYYALVTAENGATQLYTLKIRRRATYTVTFETDGGTAVDEQTVEEDGFATEYATSKTGYDFTAWDFDFDTPVTDNLTVTALWKAKEYTVTYDAKGGEVESLSTKVTYGGEYSLETPARTGYVFDGWYYEDAEINGDKWNIADDVTLEAKWQTKKYTVTFDWNLTGGNYSQYNVVYQVPYNTTVGGENGNAEFPVPDKKPSGLNTRNRFLGWADGKTDEEPDANLFPAVVESAVTYYACWEEVNAKIYTVTYNVGEVGASSIAAVNVEEDDSVRLPLPVANGYDFIGWSLTADGTADYHANDNFTPTGDELNITLYAVWRVSPVRGYTVVLDYNNGTGAKAEYKVEQGGTISRTNLNRATRKGYTLVGYSENENAVPGDTDIIPVGAAYKPTKDVTLYAVWEKALYTAVFRYNYCDNPASAGNSEAIYEQTNYRYQDMVTAPVTDPTRDGYTFKGWYPSVWFTRNTQWDKIFRLN